MGFVLDRKKNKVLEELSQGNWRCLTCKKDGFKTKMAAVSHRTRAHPGKRRRKVNGAKGGGWVCPVADQVLYGMWGSPTCGGKVSMINPNHLPEKDRQFALVLAMALERRFGRKTPAILAAAATTAMIMFEFPKSMEFLKNEKRIHVQKLKRDLYRMNPRKKIGG